MSRKAQASTQVQANEVVAKPSKAEQALAKQLAQLKAQNEVLMLEREAAAQAKAKAEADAIEAAIQQRIADAVAKAKAEEQRVAEEAAAEEKAKVDAVLAKGKTGLLYALAAGLGAATMLVAR
ncbi:MAG TPA: hypothetical protein PL000_22580 [Anaerolineales bacterium]|nr:hypothetical protein [Anaerolineales bacterium]